MSENNRRFVIGAELRAAAGDNGMVVNARAVKYGALSLPGVPMPGARERIAAGCFRDSLANGDDVVALFNHNQDVPLGRVKNGTLKLTDDKDSLRFSLRLNPDVQAHRDMHALVKDGTIGECSFAFSGVDDDWTNEDDERGNPYILRTVKSAKLHDVSLVVSPAYSDGATTAQARSLAYRFATTPTGDSGWVAEVNAKLAALGRQFAADEDAYLREQVNRLGEQIRRQGMGS
jgi:HK97 family phage prohead protease